MITTKNLDKYGQKALELVSKGENLFITGKAGTGKSTLLKLMVEYAKKEDEKEVVVLAPTGIAAKVAHGQTIHSFLRLPLDPYIPGIKNKRLLALNNDEKEVVRRTDIIFIDEVSMVRCDILDEMDYVLQQYRHNSLAFGGIQVVMFGDLYQLMPVVEEEDEKKLKKVYDNYYFFGAKVYSRMQFKMLELKHIYRQDEQDFKILLNNVRVGRVTDYEMRKLQSIYDKDFIPKDSEGYIRLTTHNRRAWKYNDTKLNMLSGPVYEFKASIDNGYVPKEEWPTEYVLKLKKGCRVMFLRNDPNKRFVNGSLGTVSSIGHGYICVKLDGSDEIIDVEKFVWEFYKYKINKQTKEMEAEVTGRFRQYPLKLAWAITIHKSQGLQFDRVVIDAGRAFAYGQIYVALSRCKHFHTIKLASKITADKIRTDPQVVKFMNMAPRIEIDGDDKHQKDERHRHVNSNPLENALWMAKDGLSIEQIVRQSGERKEIVYSHLAKLVESGDIDVHKYISDAHYIQIRKAFERIGLDEELMKIREFCEPGTTFGEINLVKASIKHGDAEISESQSVESAAIKSGVMQGVQSKENNSEKALRKNGTTVSKQRKIRISPYCE